MEKINMDKNDAKDELNSQNLPIVGGLKESDVTRSDLSLDTLDQCMVCVEEKLEEEIAIDQQEKEKAEVKESSVASELNTLQEQLPNLLKKLSMRAGELFKPFPVLDEVEPPTEIVQSTTTLCPCGMPKNKCCEMRKQLMEIVKTIYLDNDEMRLWLRANYASFVDGELVKELQQHNAIKKEILSTSAQQKKLAKSKARRRFFAKLNRQGKAVTNNTPRRKNVQQQQQADLKKLLPKQQPQQQQQQQNVNKFANKLTSRDKSKQNKQQAVERNTAGNEDGASTSARRYRPRRARRPNQQMKNIQVVERGLSVEHELVSYINYTIDEYIPDADEKLDKGLYYFANQDLIRFAQKLTLAGVGHLVTNKIRINRKNNQQAFIELNCDRDSMQSDAIITSRVGRQYAFDGDEVRAFVFNAKAEAEKENEDSYDSQDSECLESLAEITENCPKAFVIEIVKSVKDRELVGYIKFKNLFAFGMSDKEPYFYCFRPFDTRFPAIYIPVALRPLQAADEQKTYVFKAVIMHIDEYGFHVGKLDEMLGESGDLKVEVKAILANNALSHIQPYEATINKATASHLKIAEQQDGRLELTNKCIFTIDPATARDLDDALSVETVSPGLYEVGVHISDVSYYIEEDSYLDNIIKERCTSIYLINEVIHMLPEALTQHCSLLPNQNKYTFSVFWHMTEEGEIVGSPRFVRSRIRSCAQLAYAHAQDIIDNAEANLDESQFPQIYNDFTLADIKERVLILHKLAQLFRKNRYANGAISIDNPELRFTLNDDMEPLSYQVEIRQSANFMIEEFMLLANQAVADYIYKRFPQISILRAHDDPLMKTMRSVAKRLTLYGINIDYSSSKALHDSMSKICEEAKDPIAMNSLLSAVLIKPMARAKYFCSYGKFVDDLRHYALSIPIYTHFTSPIRRYPDILVHRLLAATLKYCDPPTRSTDELIEITETCNAQHFNAKNASDESAQLFFNHYVQKHNPIMLGVVIEIQKHMLSVVVIETGHTIAISYKKQKFIVDTSELPNYIILMKKDPKVPAIKLTVSSTVPIKLMVRANELQGHIAPSMDFDRLKQDSAASTSCK